MPTYLMLTRLTPEGVRFVEQDPDRIYAARKELEALDAKVLQQYALTGPWHFITVLESPHNLAAFRVALERESTGRVHTDIFPAIDLDLFSRLLGQTTETAGPFPWQTALWARTARRILRYDTLTRMVRNHCKPMEIEGRENIKHLNNPVIFIGNHSSHMDAPVLFHALPGRFKRRVAFGGAADRWFLKGRKGIKNQPWYFALSMNAFPIQRGGGRNALSYAETLLDKRWSLVIFPEGTRSTTGKMAHFRHGVSLLALAKNVPVVPIWLEGLRAMRPKGTKVITPGPALARIGNPIHFTPGTPVSEATRILYRTMENMHDEVSRARRAAARASSEELPARSIVTARETQPDSRAQAS
jgi:1-acyl-sn-glycerol-3-phosphate acyltransferase